MNSPPKKEDVLVPRLLLSLRSLLIKFLVPHVSGFCFHKDNDSVQLWVFPQWPEFIRSEVYPGTPY